MKARILTLSLLLTLAASACQTLAPAGPTPASKASEAPPVAGASAPGSAPAAPPAAIAPVAPGAPIAPPAPMRSDARQLAIAPDGGISVPGLSVSGEASVRAEPDLAYISTGVQTRAATAREAQDQNNRLMTAIIARVKDLGVSEADIRTSGVNLHPVYDRNPGQIAGYNAVNTVRVTVRDVKRVGELLDATVTAGANQQGSVQFALKDDAPLKRQALDAAVKSARVTAEAIAAAAGVRITGLVSMTDESASGPILPEMAPRAMAAPAADQMSVPVQPGQLAVSARVRVVYSFQ